VYLDASALVKLVSAEAESDALVVYLASRRARATSIVGAIELHRAGARQGDVDASEVAFVLGSFEILDLDQPVADEAARVRPVGLRALDAVHVASARELGAELEALVTYDRRMIEAARGAGLPVASPGMPGSTSPRPSSRAR
jgi:predicted nucleic acid-binding protein